MKNGIAAIQRPINAVAISDIADKEANSSISQLVT